MKSRLRSLALLLTGLAVLAGTLFTGGIINAASNGLGVTPRKDYTVKSGASVSDTLFISNLSRTDDLTVSIQPVDFAARNESGSPALQLDADAPQPPWSLRPFLTTEQTVQIAAGKSANIPIEIAIPEGQGAGSYYAAIKYLAQTEGGEQVNIAASSATLVFVTVPGKADERLDFKQFGAWVPEKHGGEGGFQTLFTGAEPKVLAYRLENLGNVAEQPAGSIVVDNLFGRTVLEVEKANPNDQLALIGQTRRFEVCLKESVVTDPNNPDTERVECTDPNLWPGRYTARMALYYGLNGNDTKEIVATTTFWYIPWWFVAAVLVVLLILAAVIWLVIRNVRLSRARKFRHKK